MLVRRHLGDGGAAEGVFFELWCTGESTVPPAGFRKCEAPHGG